MTDVAKPTIAFAILLNAPKKSGNKKKSSTGPREFLFHKGIAVLFLFLKRKSFLE
jgi:hypothetical protein